MLFDEIGLAAGHLPATAVRSICQAASDHIRLKMGGLEVTFRLAKESADIMDENGVKRGVLSLPDISAEPRSGRPTAASHSPRSGVFPLRDVLPSSSTPNPVEHGHERYRSASALWLAHKDNYVG